MQENILQLGDIIIFQADDKWISKLIAWITDSDVSHAAMIYEDAVIVELGPSGIMKSPVAFGCGEAAYQLRLNPAQETQPLLDAAKVYVDQQICYDFPALALLGALLIYRHIRPTTGAYHLIDALLNLACVAVDKLITLLRQHPNAMVCSQFVYQVYKDCGKDYEILMQDGILQLECSDKVRLIDLAQAQPMISYEVATMDTDAETLAQQLLQTFQAEIPCETITVLPAALSSAVQQYDQKLHELADAAGLPMSVLLVTPADLCYHAVNLEHISKQYIERIKF